MSEYEKDPPEPNLFEPHPNLSDGLNAEIIEAEIMGGVDITKCNPGDIIKVTTTTPGRVYQIKITDPKNAMVLISGNPKYCPTPTEAKIEGSVGSLIHLNKIIEGFGLSYIIYYSDDKNRKKITTSRIQSFKVNAKE